MRPVERKSGKILIFEPTLHRMKETTKRERQQRQLEQMKSLWKTSECALLISTKHHNNQTLQQIRMKLRPFHGILYLGKNSLVHLAAQEIYSPHHQISQWVHQKLTGEMGILFLPTLAHLGDIVTLLGTLTTSVVPRIGKTYDEDIWVRAGPSNLLPTQTGGFRSRYVVASKITRGRIEFLSDFKVIASGRMVDENDSRLCHQMGLTICYRMKLVSAIELPSGDLIPDCVLAYSTEELTQSLSSQYRLLQWLNEELSEKEEKQEIQSVEVLGDEVSCESLFSSTILDRFAQVQKSTHCVFARGAKLWASPTLWQRSETIEENCSRLLPAFRTFLEHHQSWQVDGFVIELEGAEQYAPNEESFEETCLSVVSSLQHFVPSSLNKKRSAWYYAFGETSCFLTAFAPCYLPHSSRYMIPSPETKDRCFLFLQAEHSFSRREIIPAENYSSGCPVRDLSSPAPAVCHLIRNKFQAHGQAYMAL